MSSEPIGLIDANIFVHAQTNDDLSAECQTILAALARGQVQAILEPLTLHELSYTLPRYVRQMTRSDVARYLLMIIEWPGILCDKAVMIDAVERWDATPGLGFADAYLAAIAARRRCPVFTKNVRHLAGQGVDVPNPLPSGTSAT